MDIYMVDPNLTIQEPREIKSFANAIREEITAYTNVFDIRKENIAKFQGSLNQESLVILFNGESEFFKKGDPIYNFLETAKGKNALIWPVAMDKGKRMPPEPVSEKQSYDVYEQLRCRNLGEEYLGCIAKAFARKVIARVMPTIYSENGLIFVSHRRLDGEEITAKLCDRIQLQAHNAAFRDITKVEVGQEAQDTIDEALARSDMFIFIHTEKSSESKWIQKELRYAMLRNIPILWVRIDDADISKLSITPTENPHLCCSSVDFDNDITLSTIVEEILQKAFDLMMVSNNKVFDHLNSLQELFSKAMNLWDKTNMVYSISVARKNYHYPQREIKQYVQFFGRTPTTDDEDTIKSKMSETPDMFDSIIMLTDRIVTKKTVDNLVQESFIDFYDNWSTYLQNKKEGNQMEIIISGAFPDGDEICKQSLTDALIIFAKSILKAGYTLTFGSHPTFQELFFEVAKEIYPLGYENKIKMYISEWFEDKYLDKLEYYRSNAFVTITPKEDSINASLTTMREKMIQRNDVAALICLGGKIKDNKAEEGIREEIQIAQTFGIPIFVVGSIGGCSSEIAQEIKKGKWNDINHAPLELNNRFMSSLDYFSLAQELLGFLDDKS